MRKQAILAAVTAACVVAAFGNMAFGNTATGVSFTLLAVSGVLATAALLGDEEGGGR